MKQGEASVGLVIEQGLWSINYTTVTSSLKVEGQHFILCTSHCLWAAPKGCKFPDDAALVTSGPPLF